MRRAELAKVRAMEVQQKTFFQAHLAQSKFVQKFIELPMVRAAIDTAGHQYVKVKDFNPIVCKSIELAEYVSGAVVDKVLSPIAEKGMLIASPISGKVDDMAVQGLEVLTQRMPVITEQPQEIVQNTYSLIEKPVSLVTGYTEVALKTWPAQSAMDMYEAILNTACNTLDNVLPAPNKEDKGSDSNGLATKKEYPEEEKHKRGMYLAQKTINMFTSAFRRVFGLVETQVENAATATDLVYKQVKNAVGEAPATNNEATATNGESNKPTSKKQGKNKKNTQE